MKIGSVLITRPEAQMQGFVEKLNAIGVEPVLAPMVEIEPVAHSLVPWEHQPKHLIITSQNALLNADENLVENLKTVEKVWVMGPSSYRLAKTYGLHLAEEPKRGTTSEALIETMVKAEGCDKNNAVLILGGIGGRDTLQSYFESKNIPVSRINTYKSVCPNFQYDWRKWSNHVELALFTSLATLENAITLLGTEGKQWLQSIKIVVVSQRVLDYALSQGFDRERVFVSDSAQDEDCIAKIKALL